MVKHSFDSVYENILNGNEVDLGVVTDLVIDFFHQNYKNIGRNNIERLIESQTILFNGGDMGKDLDLLTSLDTFMEINQITDCVLNGLSPYTTLIVYQKNKTVYSTVIGLY